MNFAISIKDLLAVSSFYPKSFLPEILDCVTAICLSKPEVKSYIEIEEDLVEYFYGLLDTPESEPDDRYICIQSFEYSDMAEIVTFAYAVYRRAVPYLERFLNPDGQQHIQCSLIQHCVHSGVVVFDVEPYNNPDSPMQRSFPAIKNLITSI